MTHRLTAAGAAAAVLAIGLMLTPVFARPGGLAPHGMSVPGGMRPPAVPANPAAPAAVGGARPAVPFVANPALRAAAAARIHPFRTGFFRHRNRFNSAWPLWGYGGDDYSSGYSPPYPGYPNQNDDSYYDTYSHFDPYTHYAPPAAYQSPPPPSGAAPYVVVRPTGCISDLQKVTSEHGGERAITIVRC
jgi:hypothetical protein